MSNAAFFVSLSYLTTITFLVLRFSGSCRCNKYRPRGNIYPFQEFGIVAGRIESVTEMSKDTAVLRISFPKGLVISSQKTIPFRNGLTASGEIVTEDLNLIERLFYEIRRVMKR